MTRKEQSAMFKKAHEIARKTCSLVGNYMIAFKLALKNLWLLRKLMKIERKLHEQGTFFAKGGFLEKLRKQGVKFSKNSADFRDSESIIDGYYTNVAFSYADEMYLVFCSIFGEQVVNEWLGF